MFINMPLEQITVKDLCDKAMINRRIFYLHHNSIDNILEEVIEEMAIEFIKYTNDYDHCIDIGHYQERKFLLKKLLKLPQN